MFWLPAQQLDDIGGACDEQADELVESIDGRVCVLVDILLKIRKTQDLQGSVQGAAPQIHIRILIVCTISVASAKCKKDNPIPQVRVSIEKRVGRSLDESRQVNGLHRLFV